MNTTSERIGITAKILIFQFDFDEQSEQCDISICESTILAVELAEGYVECNWDVIYLFFESSKLFSLAGVMVKRQLSDSVFNLFKIISNGV